jgi:hypothetical protein
MYREIGFVDSGSIVTYAEPTRKTDVQEKTESRLAESILIL